MTGAPRCGRLLPPPTGAGAPTFPVAGEVCIGRTFFPPPFAGEGQGGGMPFFFDAPRLDRGAHLHSIN